MPINSKAKGKRFELSWVNQCKQAGFLSARRGQQFKGTEDSADVLCSELPYIHFEVKAGARPNPWLALKQCAQDKSQDQLAVAAVHKDREPWIVCMSASDWFALVKLANISMKL